MRVVSATFTNIWRRSDNAIVTPTILDNAIVTPTIQIEGATMGWQRNKTGDNGEVARLWSKQGTGTRVQATARGVGRRLLQCRPSVIKKESDALSVREFFGDNRGLYKFEEGFLEILRGRNDACLQTHLTSIQKCLGPMDDEVELGVVLMMCFGLLAEMFAEVNEFIIIISLCYLRLRRRSMYSMRVGRIRYGLRSKVTRQLDHLHFLVNYDDETCRDHIRMNSDCFNRLCFLLQNLGGLRATRNVTISEQVAIFLTVLSHYTKNRVVKHSFRRSGYTISKHFNSVLNTILKLHRVLLVTPEPVPEDSNDSRWNYFKT
ncbi:hypothetical protein ACS0TY_026252 [Phlomoides rotata]